MKIVSAKIDWFWRFNIVVVVVVDVQEIFNSKSPKKSVASGTRVWKWFPSACESKSCGFIFFLLFFFRGNRASLRGKRGSPCTTLFWLKGFIVPLNRSAVWLAFCILIHFDFSVRLHLPQEVISTVLSTLVAVAVKSFRLWDHGPRNHEQVRRKYSGI